MKIQSNPSNIIAAAGINLPLVGLYVSKDCQPFEPYIKPEFCIFSCFGGWMRGESTCISPTNLDPSVCPGMGYWLCGVESTSRENMAHYLAEGEGLKASSELMEQWLAYHPTHKVESESVVIGPLREDQYDNLKTVTFFVNPDQLSLLITAAEYHNGFAAHHPVISKYGSGCGQLAAVFDDFDTPKATIGGTDIAMRPYLPCDILAFTVTKPMFEQLCRLDEKSFLHKSFWNNVKQARLQPGNVS